MPPSLSRFPLGRQNSIPFALQAQAVLVNSTKPGKFTQNTTWKKLSAYAEIGMWISACTHTAKACHILLWPLLLIYHYFFPLSFTNHCLIGEAVWGGFSSVTTPQKKKKSLKRLHPKWGNVYALKLSPELLHSLLIGNKVAASGTGC